MDIKALVRSIPDYPKPGIIFRDITTLLEHPSGFRRAIDELVQPFAGSGITKVAGIDAMPAPRSWAPASSSICPTSAVAHGCARWAFRCVR